MSNQMTLTKKEYFESANIETFVPVKGLRTGTEYMMREYMYAVLIPDRSHPLSCVSVSNNSFSIDLWTGCALQCSYCHVQGMVEDMQGEGKMHVKPVKRNSFTVDEIVDSLIEHPYFISDKSIISIGTSSTEPFARGEVCNSTFDLMRAFTKRGLKNPFWIVTKFGIPADKIVDFEEIAQTNKIIISLCWSNAPKEIEPARNNRFAHLEKIRHINNISVNWYMRPLVPEWNGTVENVAYMINFVKENYSGCIDSIVPGGLRWTEGIEYGLTEARDLEMPQIIKEDNIKSMSDELWESIVEMCNESFPGVPVFYHSSCALTHALEVPSITLLQFEKPMDCGRSVCPDSQRSICTNCSISEQSVFKVQSKLDEIGIPVNVVSLDEKNLQLETTPSLDTFTPAVRQTILRVIADAINN
ncbi:hypothetical protein [Thermoactinomyces sp. DSM 45892]|uniref:hypothetical protein n=1 Tax=Thermoactinomyces sp. DSM 45892 TaxID=1882753 RepID=UPI00089923FD|nr:hypothetical protein [Thermoactinomyces sp. DSM 45892]SDY23801.1 DNA repair photolyase [Thermoactinomyces sp. DSM 45892]